MGTKVQYAKIWTDSELMEDGEAFYQLFCFSKYKAAIHCDYHYHCQSPLFVTNLNCLSVLFKLKNGVEK